MDPKPLRGGSAAAPLGIALALACSPQGDAGPPTVPLTLLASTDVPPTASQSIALVAENTACVVESYEFKIRCLDRSGREVGVFGREGEGPGEFSGLLTVERGPDGGLAAIDVLLSRLTIFQPDGVAVSETRLPADFHGYGNTPKGWFRGPFRFDGRGIAWIAVNRDRDVLSYIEVWDGPTYVRTVAVRDRLIGYDLLGATLAVLVERRPDSDGVAPMAIDWYALPGMKTP